MQEPLFYSVDVGSVFPEPVYAWQLHSRRGKTSKPKDVTGKFCSRMERLFKQEADDIESGRIAWLENRGQPSSCFHTYEPTPSERKQIEKLRYYQEYYYQRSLRHYTD